MLTQNGTIGNLMLNFTKNSQGVLEQALAVNNVNNPTVHSDRQVSSYMMGKDKQKEWIFSFNTQENSLQAWLPIR